MADKIEAREVWEESQASPQAKKIFSALANYGERIYSPIETHDDPSFLLWHFWTNEVVHATTRLTTLDIPDAPYWDMWDEGIDHVDAALIALYNAGWDAFA